MSIHWWPGGGFRVANAMIGAWELSTGKLSERGIGYHGELGRCRYGYGWVVGETPYLLEGAGGGGGDRGWWCRSSSSYSLEGISHISDL